jgi:hypothetical protein
MDYRHKPPRRGGVNFGRRWGVNIQRRLTLGPLAFEYSAFSVDGRTDLSMVVYNPATPADAEKIRSKISPTA